MTQLVTGTEDIEWRRLKLDWGTSYCFHKFGRKFLAFRRDNDGALWSSRISGLRFQVSNDYHANPVVVAGEVVSS